MFTVGADQSLSNSAIYEHICLGNMYKLYKYSVKCDEQQQYKANIEPSMVYIPEVFNDNIPMSPSQSMTMKKKSTRKSLCQFLHTL